MLMKNRTKLFIVAAAVVGAAAVPAVANAGSGGDGNEVDTPITGPDLERATTVALDHLGEGSVTETEVGDEESYYEVEVTLSDGSQVDVQLDEQFNVVGTEDDGTGSDD
jgi:hypothetical protein